MRLSTRAWHPLDFLKAIKSIHFLSSLYSTLTRTILVRALRRAFAIRHLLPEFLGFLLRDQNQRRQTDKEQNKKLARRVQVPWISYFQFAHFLYIVFCRTAVRGAQFRKPMIS